jgi:hypothetical protein
VSDRIPSIQLEPGHSSLNCPALASPVSWALYLKLMQILMPKAKTIPDVGFASHRLVVGLAVPNICIRFVGAGGREAWFWCGSEGRLQLTVIDECGRRDNSFVNLDDQEEVAKVRRIIRIVYGKERGHRLPVPSMN